MPADLSRRRLLLGAGALGGAAAVGSCTDDSALAGRPWTAEAGAGTSELPGPQVWEELNRRVHGRLLRPVSPVGACAVDPDDDACAAELEDWSNPFALQDQPGATQSTGWMDAWDVAVSPYAVAAASAADVAAAVDVAREHGVRLVVKGAGHDYLGRNNAPGSLLVWTHHMRTVEVHDDFVPRGAPAGTEGIPALSVGAGTRWLEAYTAASDAGRYVQGGGCTSVGASGGFIQGSGFGSYSKAYGTGAAGVVEFEVVTADGQVRVVSDHSEPDLFWALRGGGGATFGIVTRTTLMSHAIPSVTGTVSGTVTSTDDEAHARVVRAVVDFYPRALDDPAWGEQIRFRSDRTVELALTFLDIDGDSASATIEQLLGPLRRDGRIDVDVSVREIPFASLWDPRWWEDVDPDFVTPDPRPGQPPGQYWWSGNQGEVAAYWSAYESRWVPTSLLVERPEEATDMLLRASALRDLTFQINKGLSGASEDARRRSEATPLHPSALDAAALVIMAAAQQHVYPGLPGHEPDPDEAAEGRDAVTRAMRIVREATPGQGAYANEASYFTEDWKEEFWGPHYDRLLEVKRRYDPDNLFRVHHGVGSDL